MDLSENKILPEEILAEMETLQVKGGAGSENVKVFAIGKCISNGEGAYCSNCVTGCSCSPSSGSSSENDGNNENP